MTDNANVEALIETRISAAISDMQDLPQLLKETSQNSPGVIDMWFKILVHIYNNLVRPDGTLRFLHEIEFTMISAQDRPQYADFIKLAHRWLITMQCAGVADQAFANLAQYKPRLDKDVLEVLAPHERQQCERRQNKRRAVDQAYPGLIKSEAEFWLRKGALASTTDHNTTPSQTEDLKHTEGQKIEFVRDLVQAMANMTGIADKANHHHVTAVKAMSGAVLEEVGWEVYVNARYAQQGVTLVLPWNTSFTWRRYDTFEDRWSDIVEYFWECKSAVANLLQAAYVQRYTSDPYKEHVRKTGQKRNNNSRAARNAANAEAAQQLQIIQGAAAVPGAALPVVANPTAGINVAPFGQVAILPNISPFVTPEVASNNSPSTASPAGNSSTASPHSPAMDVSVMPPALSGSGTLGADQHGFNF